MKAWSCVQRGLTQELLPPAAQTRGRSSLAASLSLLLLCSQRLLDKLSHSHCQIKAFIITFYIQVGDSCEKVTLETVVAAASAT